MSVLPFTKVEILDSCLPSASNAVQAVPVRKGVGCVQRALYNATTMSNSQLQFVVQCPEGTLLDRQAMIHAKVILVVSGTLLDGQTLLHPGQDALRNNPLDQISAIQTCLLNGQQVDSFEASRWMRVLESLHASSVANGEDAGQPVFTDDVGVAYAPAVGSMLNPLGDIASTSTIEAPRRGAYTYCTYMPAGTVACGITTTGNTAATTASLVRSVAIQFEIWAPVICEPFVLAAGSPAIPYVKSLNLTYSFYSSNLGIAWSHALGSGAAAANSAAFTSVAMQFSTAELILRHITPDPTYVWPEVWNLHKKQLQYMISPQPLTVAAVPNIFAGGSISTTSTTCSFGSQRMTRIPSRIFIWAQPAYSTLAAEIPNYCLPITQLSFNVSGVPGQQFSNYTQADLYKMSKKAGLKRSMPLYLGQSKIAGAPIATCSGPIVIPVSVDGGLQLPTNVAPGMQTEQTFSFTCNVQNQSTAGGNIQAEVYIGFEFDDILQFAKAGPSPLLIQDLVNPLDYAESSVKIEDDTSLHAADEFAGAGFFDSVGKGFRTALRYAPQVISVAKDVAPLVRSAMGGSATSGGSSYSAGQIHRQLQRS